MLDFTPIRNRQFPLPELVAREQLRPNDLLRLTNEMVETMLALIADCADADVVLVPDDPEAYDSYAATEDELKISWTLGHVIVHTTASAEESAFLAAELARGVAHHPGRSRYEIPWEKVTTIDQCRARLEASRKMRLASLDLWPNPPHLENTYIPREGLPPFNAIARFVGGLMHDDSHLGQIAEIVRQARAALSATLPQAAS